MVSGKEFADSGFSLLVFGSDNGFGALSGTIIQSGPGEIQVA